MKLHSIPKGERSIRQGFESVVFFISENNTWIVDSHVAFCEKENEWMRRWRTKLAICLLAVMLTGCAGQPVEESQRVERSLFAMNTYMTFTAYGEEAEAD